MFVPLVGVERREIFKPQIANTAGIKQALKPIRMNWTLADVIPSVQ
jgi:hypothetical protein